MQGGVHIGMSCPRYVKGDAGRINQMLTNLIDNAVKFTLSGSVKLHVNAGETYGKLKLRFDVIDTGSASASFRGEGPVPALRSGRAQRTPSRRHRARTFIARRLVELMGGEIGCESAPGQGSLFWFTIPAERAARRGHGAEPMAGSRATCLWSRTTPSTAC